MKLTTISVLAALALQAYPPPFPREGVTKLFENEWVVVWHGVFPKNRPTAMHEHKLDLVGVFLSHGQVKNTTLDGSVRLGKPFGPNHVVFQPSGVIHSEESFIEGTKAVGIELKGPPKPSVLDSSMDAVKLAPSIYRTLLDNERVRVIELIARPGETRPRHAHPGRLMVQPALCPNGLTAPPSAITTPDGVRVWWVNAETHGPSTGTAPEECRYIEVEIKGAR